MRCWLSYVVVLVELRSVMLVELRGVMLVELRSVMLLSYVVWC